MYFHPFAEETILLIITCFSLLNLAFITALNKEKSFPKLFGLSFLLPFILAFLCQYYPEPVFHSTMLPQINILFLFYFYIILFLWSRKKYSVSLIVILSAPLLELIILRQPLPVPAFLRTAYFLAGVTILLTVLNVFILRKRNKEGDLLLSWGVIILGFSQSLYIMAPAQSQHQSLLLVTAGIFGSYLLFFIYILKNSRDLCLARLRNAEAKVADMNKMINYEVKKRLLEVERHNEHLLNMVQRDPLVDAYNKKGIMNIMQEMVHEPGKDPFTVMLFDIDNFKKVNDTQGHVEGDSILKKVAKLAKENIRGFDLVGRYGGDEFIIVLPGTNLSDAIFVAERFRKRVDTETHISVSIGIAAFPEDGETVKKLIEVADAGLYESKRRGKNAVSHHLFK